MKDVADEVVLLESLRVQENIIKQLQRSDYEQVPHWIRDFLCESVINIVFLSKLIVAL